MTIQSPEKVESMEKALVILSDKIVIPKDADFDELGAYVFPLRSQVPVVLEVKNERGVERRELTRGNENVIVRLHLPDESQLFQMMYLQHKGAFEHGGLERQLQAFHHSDQRYKHNVLDKYWVKTGEMGIRAQKGHEFYRVTGITPRQVSFPIVFDDEAQTSKPALDDYSYTLGRELRVPIPSRTGTYSKLGNTEGKWYWNGVVYEDNEGRSAVGCLWYSDGRGLDADAFRPLNGGGNGALGTWKAPLNK